MPRGIIPRQPARTGRQDKLRTVPASVKPVQKQARIGNVRPGSRAATSASKSAKPLKSAKGYNPTAPDRVTEILKRLNDLYPDVTCALSHSSAWELLVATIL